MKPGSVSGIQSASGNSRPHSFFPFFEQLYENFKRLSVYQAGHYMCRGIPTIEFAYERYAFRPRRPHAEHKSFLSAAGCFVRPEKLVSFIIYAVMK